jgi:hypothetical protein
LRGAAVSEGQSASAGGCALWFFLSRRSVNEAAARPDHGLGSLKGFGNRIDNGQAVIGDHSGQSIQRGAADHAAVQSRQPMFVNEHLQNREARTAEEFQLAEVKDQRGFQTREAGDLLSHEMGIRCVDRTVDAQNGGNATRVDMQLRSGAIDLVAVARLLAQVIWAEIQ